MRRAVFYTQSSHYPTLIKRYPLKGRDEIVSSSFRTKEIEVERFGILPSGNSLMRPEIYEIAAALQKIREKVGIKVCASLMAFLLGANGMLIGGYLTIKRRDVEEDHILVKEILKAWRI